MNKEIALKIAAVQEAAEQDEQYQVLLEEYRILDKRFLDMLPTLTKEQRDAVTDYLGVVFEMQRRQLEIACAWDKNVEKDKEFL